MPEASALRKYSTRLKWQERNLRLKAAYVIGLAWTTYILCVLFDIFFYFGMVVYPLAHNAICAGTLIILSLLVLPSQKKGVLGRLNILEILLISLTFIGATYIAINAEELLDSWRNANPTEMVLGIGVMLAALESTRRTAGWAPVILVVGSFFYFVYSDYFPGFLMSTGYSYPRAIAWMFLSGEGMWGSIVGTVATTVPGFILFGCVLRATGGSEFFSDLALACMGKYRGGPAKTAVVSSMFFGSISGAPAANVATTGTITIPMMKSNGFSPELAGAVEAVASTGGCFTPPVMGAVSFLIADILGLSYWSVCAAAFLPALTYYGILLFQIDSEAIKLKLVGLPKDRLPQVALVLKKGWLYIVPFAVLLFCLGFLGYSAQSSILYTVIAQVLCSSLSPETRINFKKMLVIFDDTAYGLTNVLPVCTAIGILVGVLNISGTGAGLASALASIAGNNQAVLLSLTAITIFFMGMGMTALACYLLAVAMLIPALIGSGVLPIAAHMFLFYYGTLSFITPPVAIAAFVAAGIADGDSTRTGLYATRLGLSAYLLPFFFITNPGILWVGSLGNILFDFAGVFGALMLISSAFTGIMFGPISQPVRIIMGILGAMFVVPFPNEVNIILVPLIWAVIALYYVRFARKKSAYQNHC